MTNLAGNADCDRYIEKELERCGIEIVRNQPREGEVASSLRGKLGPFTFKRAWYYWIVDGPVPLAVAKELYNDPVGRDDVRVNGFAGGAVPGDANGGWTTKRDPETGKELINRQEWDEIQAFVQPRPHLAYRLERLQPSDDPTAGEEFIETYHIDTEIGLRLFADTIKKHGLVTASTS